MRRIYMAPKSMKEPKRDALWNAYLGLSYEAKVTVAIRGENLLDCERGYMSNYSGIREMGVARRLAADARAMIAAFGVRVDGKRARPFPHAFPETRDGRQRQAS